MVKSAAVHGMCIFPSQQVSTNVDTADQFLKCVFIYCFLNVVILFSQVGLCLLLSSVLPSVAVNQLNHTNLTVSHAD